MTIPEIQAIANELELSIGEQDDQGQKRKMGATCRWETARTWGKPPLITIFCWSSTDWEWMITENTRQIDAPMRNKGTADNKEELVRQEGFEGMPLFYFTQLLALALGLDSGVSHFELNHGDPEAFLSERGLLQKE